MTVVLELTDVQVDSLAQQIARIGGEPIAGFRFAIDSSTRRAHGIQVDGKPLESGRRYRLATSDYLADGGGGMPALWNPAGRENLNLLLRDAFIQYVRDKGTIVPEMEGRIVVGN
jgi:2',3'-cyclic-nucleotide 2'-phosphodiesterase (5'-nucleotidase family)